MAVKENANPKRGEVFLVNFDSSVGAEIKKLRPALVIQNDVANLHSQMTIVAAITSKIEPPLYPTEVKIAKNEGGLEQESLIVLSQIRSFDKQRLIQRLGKVRSETLALVDEAIKMSLGLVDL